MTPELQNALGVAAVLVAMGVYVWLLGKAMR